MNSTITDEQLKEFLKALLTDEYMGFVRTVPIPVSYARSIVSELLAAREALSVVTDMDRSQEFRDGYRCAQRDVFAWLRLWTNGKRDPNAVVILHSAATNLAWYFAHHRQTRNRMQVDSALSGKRSGK